jgi:hypothetical protein
MINASVKKSTHENNIIFNFGFMIQHFQCELFIREVRQILGLWEM